MTRHEKDRRREGMPCIYAFSFSIFNFLACLNNSPYVFSFFFALCPSNYVADSVLETVTHYSRSMHLQQYSLPSLRPPGPTPLHVGATGEVWYKNAPGCTRIMNAAPAAL